MLKKHWRRGLALPTSDQLATKRTPRGPAVEQGIVSGDRKPRSSCYWYARRIRLRKRCLDEKSHRKGRKVMVKPSPVPPINQPLVDRESHFTAMLRFGTKLLRKRATYERYFAQALTGGQIDSALRRVATRRCFELKCSTKSVFLSQGEGRSESSVQVHSLRFSLELTGNPPVKECGRKEKKILQKYALRVRARLAKRLAGKKKFEGTSEQRAKRRYLERKRKDDEASKAVVIAGEAARRKRYGGGFAPPPSLTGQSNTGRGVAGGRVFASTVEQLNRNRWKGGPPPARPDSHR